MNAAELWERLKSANPPAVVDVRTGYEFRKGHIAGALHAPGWKILFRLADLPRDRDAELVLTCEHGPRAELAKKMLELQGYRHVELLDGHMAGWRGAGRPMEK